MQAKNLRPSDLAAIGITNQRETTVVWDRKTGEPVYNAIVWQDTRVADAVAEFAREADRTAFAAKPALPLATYFSGSEDSLDSRRTLRARAQRPKPAIFFRQHRHVSDLASHGRRSTAAST